MMNLALDDMDAVVGMALPGGRIPVTEIVQAMKGRAVLNNIRVTNSNVGVLNTGDLARIDAVITLTRSTDVEAIGAQLQRLTQTVVDSADIDPNCKKEMLGLIQSLAEQVVGPRKPSVIKALLQSIEERAKGIAAIFSVFQSLATAIKQLFGA
jgi:hypothetical protein